MTFRRNIKKSKAADGARKKPNKVICKLILQHADITIMEGKAVQELFEVRRRSFFSSTELTEGAAQGPAHGIEVW